MRLKFLCAKKRGFQPGSWLIQKVEKLPFSHFAISVDDVSVYEAVHPMSRKVSKPRWLREYEEVEFFEFNISDYQTSILVEKILNENLHKEYSILQLVSIYLGLFIDELRFVRWNGRKKLICSEYAAIVIERIFGSRFKMSNDEIGLIVVYQELKKLKERHSTL
jgi:hypothetical protein